MRTPGGDRAIAPDDAAGTLLRSLRAVVGRRHVLTGAGATRRHAIGYRVGSGAVLAVVRPGTLVEQWRVLRECTFARVIVIMQAANTGLTGGSTPFGAYDRPVVIVNTLRIRGILHIAGGAQVVCLPGATLHDLEQSLAPIGREPHSVIGSSCLGASVLGGVCNNSGGALIRRGPAYTELALFARIDAGGDLRLVNHLGIDLGDDPEAVLGKLDRGDVPEADVEPLGARLASDRNYGAHVRDVESATPARFNADPSRLFEASGCGGKVALFAARLETFPRDEHVATFYIGSNDPADLATVRRDMLGGFEHLPVLAEYIHRTAFDIAETYGKDIYLAIRHLGTSRLPLLFGLKNRIDGVAGRMGAGRDLSDRMLQWLSARTGRHLPPRLYGFRDRFEHHLILQAADGGIGETRAYLAKRYPSLCGDAFECTAPEASGALRHRFAVAGAAVRYRAIHAAEVEDIVALDIALRRNDADWFETLPPDVAEAVIHPLYYGHFFCNVFHQDYIIRKGRGPHALEARMLEELDRRGAEYPAEHNVGHLYAAKAPLAAHYERLDPCNVFNPGIGRTARAATIPTCP